MKLIIAEKPSVAAAIAAALDVRNRKDGYIEGGGYLISWCVGHLVGLAEAAAYGEQYRKWSYRMLKALDTGLIHSSLERLIWDTGFLRGSGLFWRFIENKRKFWSCQEKCSL